MRRLAILGALAALLTVGLAPTPARADTPRGIGMEQHNRIGPGAASEPVVIEIRTGEHELMLACKDAPSDVGGLYRPLVSRMRQELTTHLTQLPAMVELTFHGHSLDETEAWARMWLGERSLRDVNKGDPRDRVDVAYNSLPSLPGTARGGLTENRLHVVADNPPDTPIERGGAS